MLKQYLLTSKQYLNQVTNKPQKRKDVVRQLLESPHFQSWIYLDTIIRYAQEKMDQVFLKLIRDLIEGYFRNVKSLPMMMFLYGLQVQNRLKLEFISWALLYKSFCVQDNQLVIFNSWAFNEQNYSNKYDLIQNTLQMTAKHYIKFLSQNSIPFTDLQFDTIIQWLLRMRTQTPEKFQIAISLSKQIKNINIVKHQKDYISKQHLVIKKLFENIRQPINDSGNAFLLLQPEQYYTDREVNYFCHIYYDYLNDLSEEYLNQAFRNMTIGGITGPFLIIIDKVSSLLATNQEYFKLRYLYQNFILPRLTKFKASRTLGKEVYQLVEFYVLGFLRHCYIGKNGIEYLLQGIENIQSKAVQTQWINLAMTAAVANNLKQETQEVLSLKKLSMDNPTQPDLSKTWNVTLRTGKKYKKYTKLLTPHFKGMQNKANECYIISVVQGLYFSRDLQRLLDENRDRIKGRLPVLDELRILFGELQGKRNVENVVISYLKRCGPEEFRSSNNQEDTMHYLIQLFGAIEGECRKVPGMLEKFDSIFKIDCQHTTKCLNCQTEKTNIENTYIHTIPHTQILHLKIEQPSLPDYICERCHKAGSCQNTRIISPKSKMFVVHINRFSIKDGVCKKQLSNQTILRRFLNYQLCGIICHIGKNIDSGHYIFFAKVGEKTWVELNDKIAYMFQVDDEGEEFEREMKTDMTPYILFYRRVD